MGGGPPDLQPLHALRLEQEQRGCERLVGVRHQLLPHRLVSAAAAAATAPCSLLSSSTPHNRSGVAALQWDGTCGPPKDEKCHPAPCTAVHVTFMKTRRLPWRPVRHRRQHRSSSQASVNQCAYRPKLPIYLACVCLPACLLCLLPCVGASWPWWACGPSHSDGRPRWRWAPPWRRCPKPRPCGASSRCTCTCTTQPGRA